MIFLKNEEIIAKVQTEEQRDFLLEKLNNKSVKHLRSKIMFEKEAERYVDEEYDFCYYPEDNLSARINAERDWQKGAEFGYNKANEWHKQEIDDIFDSISKDWDIRYFVCIMKDKNWVTATGNCDEGCNGEVSVNLFFDHDDDKYYMDDIVWWKEIVLPKESE